MLLKKWNELPEKMKNKKVKKYYDILVKKKKQLILKRVFDIVMSFILIVILSPAMLVISILIKFDSKGTVLYKQERVTQYGRIFKIFKFRTMVSNADQIGALVTMQDDQRITNIGSKIRKCRFDEFPQLFNILMGDMTFVGTRPEVIKYVECYTDEMLATLLLPAGVTSLASIEFRDEDILFDKYLDEKHDINDVYLERILPEKMIFNLHYLNQLNLLKDVMICLRTIT